MTDFSVPVGDRGPEPAVRGPALVRQALGSLATGRAFEAEVIRVATEAGWVVSRPAEQGNGAPTLVLVKGEDHPIILTWVFAGPGGYQVSEWMARWRRVRGFAVHHWEPRYGLGPVVEALSGADQLAAGVPPESWAAVGPPRVDECGVPERRRRRDG